MRTVGHNFRQAKLSVTKRGECSVCGLPATRSHTGLETLNPFNVNEDGSVKNANDTHASLKPKLGAGMMLPLVNARCEVA